MSSQFLCQLRVPLGDAGWFDIKVDLPDISELNATDRDLAFGALAQAMAFAKDHAVGAVADRASAPLALEPPATSPAAKSPTQAPKTNGVTTAQCPSCGYAGTPHGLKIHTARLHPRQCAEPECKTFLSSYNKTQWCSVHEGSHAA